MRITVLTYSRQKSHIIRKSYCLLFARVDFFCVVSAVSVIAGWKLIHPKRLNILDFSAISYLLILMFLSKT